MQYLGRITFPRMLPLMMNLQSSAPVWIARCLFHFNNTLQFRNLHPILFMRMTQHQATGFRVQGIGKRGHARQSTTGLNETIGMGNMRGVSEGIELTPNFVW